MTHAFFETSRSKGAPVHLFFFQWGPGALEYFAFTDAEQIVTYNSISFQPVPIRRGQVSTNGTLDRSETEVRIVHNNPVARLFESGSPDWPISLVIYQGHAFDSDEEFVPIWHGRVLGVTWEGYEAVLSGEPVISQRRRPGLRRHYQYGCPHVLYSSGPGKCNANKTAATFEAVVSAVEGSIVTLQSGWFDPQLVQVFENGMLEWQAQSGSQVTRTILQVNNDRELTLDAQAGSLVVGSTVRAVYGCGHTPDSCRTVHRNIVNFGGTLWIPVNNPLGSGVNNFY